MKKKKNQTPTTLVKKTDYTCSRKEQSNAFNVRKEKNYL